MIPSSNTSHVVLALPFERLNNLLTACRDAGVLPNGEPAAGGWDTFSIDFPRFDLRLSLRFRAEIGQLRLDAWQPGASPELRLGVTISIVETILEAVELSSGTSLGSIDFALSGRAYISGTLEAQPTAVQFLLKGIRVTIDDTTYGIPLPWPEIDLEEILSKLVDRTVRARLLPSGVPARSFPVNLQIQTGGLTTGPLFLGYALRDLTSTADWLSQNVCLPPGYGSPTCGPGVAQTDPFFVNLNTYAAPAGVGPPQAPNLVGRQFQFDLGVDLIRQAIASKRDPSWSDSKKFGPFKFDYDLEADVRPWPGATDGSAGFWFGFRGTESFWYPKVKTCQGWTDTPFGKISYDYPCGIEDGWQEVQDVDIQIMVRFFSSGGQICFERTQIAFNTDTNYWGALYKYIVETLIAEIPIIGWIIDGALEAVDMIVMIAELLAYLVARLIDSVVPNQLCIPIGQNFAQVPVIGDRVVLLLSNPFAEMKTTGITIAFDGDFHRR